MAYSSWGSSTTVFYVGTIRESTCYLARRLAVVLMLQPVSGSPTGTGVDREVRAGSHGLLPSLHTCDSQLWVVLVLFICTCHSLPVFRAHVTCLLFQENLPGPRGDVVSSPPPCPDTSSGLGRLLPSSLYGHVSSTRLLAHELPESTHS